MRRGLRRNYAFNFAFTEILPALRNALADAVAHERSRRRAGRADAHPASDQAGAQRQHPVAGQLRPGLEYDLQIYLGCLAAEAQPLLHGQQDFADAEQADDRDEKIKTAEHLLDAERQAQLASHLVEPNRAEPESKHPGSIRLDRRLLAEADKAAESQEIDRENLGRPEPQAKTSHHRANRADNA